MTDLIVNILGAAAVGYLGADFLANFEWLPDKPWKCNMCLTFWLTVVPFSFMYGYQGFMMAALAAIVSEWMYKHI